MGCCSSQAGKQVDVNAQRRRLSVERVDGTAGPAGGENTADADRGLLSSLDDQSLLELIEQSGEKGRKMSIGSQTDTPRAGKSSFSNKSVQRSGDPLDPVQLGLGYTCRKGLKPESPNQDSWCILKMDRYSMYAVFDGHGQKGHDCSQFVKENLPKLIVKDPRFKSGDKTALLRDSFKRTQSLLATADRMKKVSATMSGTTATVCIHDHAEGKLTLAHVADSTCVLGKKKNGQVEGVALTRDHKPNLRDEKARIEKSGGRVVFDGYANHRVYAKNARYPGLNMSRCLGDLMGHQDCGISSEPEVKEFKITREDSVLLICSDGVWEFITPTQACQIVLQLPVSQAMGAAEALAKEAWDAWIREEGGSVVDDITVILAHLNQK